MKLSDLGEFGFIKRIAERYPARHPAIIKGIGDDAAALLFTDNKLVLFSTDQLVEGVHFRLETTDAHALGWKCLAVNVSDIAAMGGTPVGVTISLGIPAQRIDVEFLEGFYEGLMSLATETGVDLLGGDTSESGERLIISVSILGRVPKDQVIYRSGGNDGDDLYVTGFLGDAAFGMIVLEKGGCDSDREALTARHLRPVPRLEEGRLLAQRGLAHAMIDISDGLLADLHHVTTESGMGAEVDLTTIPLSNALRTHAQTYNVEPLALALRGGEDYELLFSASPERRTEIEQLHQRSFCPITRIGKLSRRLSGIVLKDGQGRTVEAGPKGYDHFLK